METTINKSIEAIIAKYGATLTDQSCLTLITSILEEEKNGTDLSTKKKLWAFNQGLIRRLVAHIKIALWDKKGLDEILLIYLLLAPYLLDVSIEGALEALLGALGEKKKPSAETNRARGKNPVETDRARGKTSKNPHQSKYSHFGNHC